jgi:hypothetical protein
MVLNPFGVPGVKSLTTKSANGTRKNGEKIQRRGGVKKIAFVAPLLYCYPLSIKTEMETTMTPVEKLLRMCAFRPVDIDQFLDPKQTSWSRFDPETGYVPGSLVLKDGVDDSRSIYTYGPQGNRLCVNGAGQPCRINTYGDSFGQGQQVSDGETWQEQLAAHLGEPVRNFGAGGHGVYQFLLRARRVEVSASGAEHVIFNIYDDDHVRSLDACRWIRTFPYAPEPPANKAIMLHGLPWAHVRLDRRAGRFTEQPSPAPTPDHLRRLCDPDTFHQTFKDDEIARLFSLQWTGADPAFDVREFEELAEYLGLTVNLRSPETRRNDARLLRIAYGLRATEYILDQARAFLASKGKRLMVLLCYGEGRIMDGIAGKPRFDQSLLDYLQRHQIPFADSLASHVRDYQDFRITPQEYIDRFFINAKGAAVFGHYNPLANHFYAFWVKDRIIEWLDPKPRAYRSDGHGT